MFSFLYKKKTAKKNEQIPFIPKEEQKEKKSFFSRFNPFNKNSDKGIGKKDEHEESFIKKQKEILKKRLEKLEQENSKKLLEKKNKEYKGGEEDNEKKEKKNDEKKEKNDDQKEGEEEEYEYYECEEKEEEDDDLGEGIEREEEKSNSEEVHKSFEGNLKNSEQDFLKLLKENKSENEKNGDPTHLENDKKNEENNFFHSLDSFSFPVNQDQQNNNLDKTFNQIKNGKKKNKFKRVKQEKMKKRSFEKDHNEEFYISKLLEKEVEAKKSNKSFIDKFEKGVGVERTNKSFDNNLKNKKKGYKLGKVKQRKRLLKRLINSSKNIIKVSKIDSSNKLIIEKKRKNKRRRVKKRMKDLKNLIIIGRRRKKIAKDLKEEKIEAFFSLKKAEKKNRKEILRKVVAAKKREKRRIFMFKTLRLFGFIAKPIGSLLWSYANSLYHLEDIELNKVYFCKYILCVGYRWKPKFILNFMNKFMPNFMKGKEFFFDININPISVIYSILCTYIKYEIVSHEHKVCAWKWILARSIFYTLPNSLNFNLNIKFKDIYLAFNFSGIIAELLDVIFLPIPKVRKRVDGFYKNREDKTDDFFLGKKEDSSNNNNNGVLNNNNTSYYDFSMKPINSNYNNCIIQQKLEAYTSRMNKINNIDYSRNNINIKYSQNINNNIDKSLKI